MTVDEIAAKLDLHLCTNGDASRLVTGAYCSDMLSDVMSRARAGQVWITMQSHRNVAAVALLTNVSAVIIIGGHEASDDLLERAREESLLVYTTSLSAYEVAGRIYQLLAGC